MKSQETAEKIVGMFAALGTTARIQRFDSECYVILGEEPRRVEAVFCVTAAGVEMLPVHLRFAGSLRARRRPISDMDVIAKRCQAIVDLMRKDAETRARWAEAQAVADKLKALGLPVTVVSARVNITLDFSPEYAAEKGPQIAAVLGKRKST